MLYIYFFYESTVITRVSATGTKGVVVILEQTVKACYTPEEVRKIVFADTISLSTIRLYIRKGQIPSLKLGEGTRSKVLIPGSYVREMQEKGYCV